MAQDPDDSRHRPSALAQGTPDPPFRNGQTSPVAGNSLLLAPATVVVSVAVGAPAGYVLSRGRSKAVSAYSLLLFLVCRRFRFTVLNKYFSHRRNQRIDRRAVTG
ncbi:hypothetical protein ABT174_33890 [Streptomyces sparsogenes]|uniref:hypothetical protein n=1 Tax=Streptomyces sparsogenes TaxID=67365 RepID=UPI0033240725